MKNKLYSLIFLLLSLCIFTGLRVLATDNSGKILVDKTSVKDDFIYGREALVNLKVNGVEYSKYKNLEIVFVLDRSTSMDNNNKIQNVKSSTKKVIEELLKNDNVKVGIVTFGDDVLDDYTSKLTNDKDSLVNLINNIPNNSYTLDYFGLGTNISSALEQASNLFSNSKDTNKTIILLSDGEPTYFNYDNTTYGNGEDDISYCVEWDKLDCTLKYSPSEYTKKVAKEIKENNIVIYSVGFEVNNTAKTLLTTISDKYYSSKNSEKDLIDSFNSAIESITVIGKDIVITDTIPSYFNINKEEILKDYPNTTIINNNDGSITLKFYLDKIDTLSTYNFNYNVYTKNNYYGYIYTNTMATIEGTSLVEGIYENNKIYEVFERPIIEIPSITNNDSYSVKLGTTLITDNVSGILNNDYLELINDKDAKIKDKIVIEDTTNSCGELKVNEDGSFGYKPEVNCLGKQVEFTYYIETTINDKVVKSNTSKISINVLKDSVSIVNPKIDKNGTTNIEDINSLVEYKISYSSIIENYLGDAKITIVDKLPCKIDKDKSVLEGAIYNEKELTLTWIIDIKDINTYDNGKKLIDITKEIKLKYVNITDYRNLTNNVEVKLETSEKNNIVKDSTDTSINIKGNVIVSYVDNEGNKLLEDVVINDLVNNDYVTKEEKIEDYVLVEVVGQVSGKISLEEKQVNYIYYHNSANYEENLIKTGTLKIDNYDNRIDYNIKYDTIIDNYIGEVEVIIIDYLPYKIDVDNSILNNFIYHKEDNTLVYSFKENIDTYKNGSYSINIDEDLTLKYIDINEEDRVIKNIVESIIVTDTSTVLKDSFVTNIEIKSDVIGEYVDESGNKIANDIVISNLVGNDYVLDKLDVEGYSLKEIKGDDVGKHTKDDIKVTFIYEKNKLIPPKTGGNNINYSSILLVITTCLTSIIFRKKMIDLSK